MEKSKETQNSRTQNMTPKPSERLVKAPHEIDCLKK